LPRHPIPKPAKTDIGTLIQQHERENEYSQRAQVGQGKKKCTKEETGNTHVYPHITHTYTQETQTYTHI